MLALSLTKGWILDTGYWILDVYPANGGAQFITLPSVNDTSGQENGARICLMVTSGDQWSGIV